MLHLLAQLTPESAQGWIALLGAPGSLAAGLLFALWKGWIVTGREFHAVCQDRDFYRERFFRGLNLLERQQQTTERAVSVAQDAAGRSSTGD